MYCCSCEYRNTTVRVFNRDLKYKVGISETIRFLTLRQLIISKLQWHRRQIHDVTVIWNDQMGLVTTICGARVSFWRPVTTNTLFASTLPRTGWVGAPKLTLSPGAGNPRCTTAPALEARGHRPVPPLCTPLFGDGWKNGYWSIVHTSFGTGYFRGIQFE